MALLANGLVALVAALNVYFLALEMVFWTQPLGLKTFFLLCVIVAGTYGGYSVSRRILYVQALPAVVALALVWAA